MEIKSLKAREILDSRGNPTVEVKLVTEKGVFKAAAPSGASTGKNEAVEIRDGGKRYSGKGVLKAVENVNKAIAPKLKKASFLKSTPSQDIQKKTDDLMNKIDGTENKSNLGANAILPVSISVSRAGAAEERVPLYQYVGRLSGNSAKKEKSIPRAAFNVINGGVHAGNELGVQEFMIVPDSSSFSGNLRIASEIYHKLEEIIRDKYGASATNVGDEGGFAPGLGVSEQALNLILEALKKRGYKTKTDIVLDVAASELFKKGKYKMPRGIFTKKGLMRYYSDLLSEYPLLGIEDPFGEEDWNSWKKFTSKYGNKGLYIIGDDLLTTNPQRIEEAYKKGACNALLLKVNQIGTVSESIKAFNLARSYGWKVMVSHRSGETCDDFIADLAVGLEADFIKSGAPARSERLSKYNRMLEIEEETS